MYPVIGVPPLSAGGVHLIVIYVKSALSLVGESGVEGTVAAISYP